MSHATQDLELARYERALRAAGRDVVVVDRRRVVEAWALKLPRAWRPGETSRLAPFAVRVQRSMLIAWACFSYAKMIGLGPEAGSEHGTAFDEVAWAALERLGFRVVRVLIVEATR